MIKKYFGLKYPLKFNSTCRIVMYHFNLKNENDRIRKTKLI